MAAVRFFAWEMVRKMLCIQVGMMYNQCISKGGNKNGLIRNPGKAAPCDSGEASRGRMGREKAEALKAAAKTSVGTYSPAQELKLQMLLEIISLLNKQISVLKSKIKETMIQIDSPITTIPGISWTLGAIILAEIGDIKRFSSPAKVLSFAGSEPSVYQSGKFSAASGTMVKRGSHYLRWALLQAARTVPLFSSTFSAYFNKKLDEGKHYCVATSHCAKKLVRVIFALLYNNSPFSDLYISNNY